MASSIFQGLVNVCSATFVIRGIPPSLRNFLIGRSSPLRRPLEPLYRPFVPRFVFFQRGEARVPPGSWHGSRMAPWDGVREQNRPIVWVGHPALSRSPPAWLPHYTHDVMIHRPQPSNPRENGASPVVQAGRVPGIGRRGPRYYLGK